MGGNISLYFKLLFRVVVVVSCLWLLLVGTLKSGGTTATTTTTLRTQSTGKLKHEKVLGRGEFVANPELDLNDMSKRRVPNGPDPIHNRRAGNSRRPPGQA